MYIRKSFLSLRGKYLKVKEMGEEIGEEEVEKLL